MEELFRMLLVRNAEAASVAEADVAPDDTPLQEELRSASVEGGREAVLRRLDEFSRGPEFAAAVDELGSAARLRDLHDALRGLAEPSDQTVGDALTRHLGEGFHDRVGGREWQDEKRRLTDSLVTAKFLPSLESRPITGLTTVLRTMCFAERWVEGRGRGTNAEELNRQLRRPLLLPILPLLEVRADTAATDLPPTPTVPGRAELEELGARVGRIDRAIDELTRIPPRLFRVHSITEEAEPSPPAGNGSGSVFSRLFGFSSSTTAPSIHLGVGEEARLALSSAGVREISQDARTLLGEHGFDLERDSLSLTVAGLDAYKAGLVRDLRPTARSLPFTLGEALGVGYLGFGDRFVWSPPWLHPDDPPGLPETHGTVRPVGEGELLVVRQQLVRYEGGEVAHIENILQGENKNRTHRRRELTEEIWVEERELEREEERNLETTERFQLSRETNETIKEQLEVGGGLKVKIQPNPAVVVEANAKVAYSNARETARRKASEYAREIVEKSVNRLSEKIRKQETLRLVREIEEVNEHGFDNADGDGHVVGVYQWVDKLYEAQVYRYGGRTMYDFVVPEPAAFLTDALEEDVATERGLRRPDPFELTAGELTEEDYLFYANKYHATGIEPPPRFEQVRSVSFVASGGDGEGSTPNLAQKENITIPENYEAVQAHVTAAFTGKQLHVAVGRRSVLFETISGSRSFNLDLEKGSLPVTMVAAENPLFALSVEVVCRRTDRALLNWRIQTHAEIKQAYLNEVARYEEAIAQAAIARGVVIEGDNPGINRELEATELKKHCITILTHQHYDVFNGIELGAHGVPQVNVGVAEEQGDYIRFFEHAFEWHLMSFVFYPYFWGRKQTWIDRVRYENQDPEFAEFIKAGAARVLLPVREGFEAAVEHFMRTGEVWEGGPLPEITDPDYLPIVREIQDRTGAPGDEVPEGEPWFVRIPTRLIRLRPDGTLPTWAKNEEGEWMPEELVEVGGDGGDEPE